MITPGELSVGQWVSVLKWKPRELPSFGFLSVASVVHEDRSYCGDALKVVAINLPYVVAEHWTYGRILVTATLDTRLCDLIELSGEFVKASAGVESL